MVRHTAFRTFWQGFEYSRPISQIKAQHFLLPGGQALIGPGILHSLNETAPRTGRLNLARIEKANHITLSLDLVIFDDGLVIGPDSAGMVSSVENRQVAIRRVLSEVRSTAVDGGSLNTLLARLAVPLPRGRPVPNPGFASGGNEKDKTVEGWISQIARLLILMLRSSDLDTAMSRLEIPIPPFYRKLET